MLKLWNSFKFALKSGWPTDRVGKFANLAKDLLLGGKQGLEEKYIVGPEAEAALKLSEATSNLIISLEKVDKAVIRAGPLLLVKMTEGGVSQIAVETISVDLKKILDENPELLRNPNELFFKLKKLGSKIRQNKPSRRGLTSERQLED